MDLSEITSIKSAAPILDTLRDGAGRLGRTMADGASDAGKAIGTGIRTGVGKGMGFLGRNMEAGLDTQVKAFDPKTMGMVGAGLGGLAGGLGGLAFGGKGKRLRTALLGLLAGGAVGGGAGAFAGQEMGRAAQLNVPDDIRERSFEGGTTPHMRRDAKISIKDLPTMLNSTFGSKNPGALRGQMNRTIGRNNPGIYDAHR